MYAQFLLYTEYDVHHHPDPINLTERHTDAPRRVRQTSVAQKLPGRSMIY